MANTFAKSDEDIRKPYHYTECGLDDVYLLNGYQIHDTPYGKGVSIDNAKQLHKVIARQLCQGKGELKPKEFKFLRKLLNMTQAHLAKLLRCDYQTVARWEKGQTNIPGMADLVIRMLFLGQDNEKIDVAKFISELSDLDDLNISRSIYEQQKNGKWKQAA